VQETDVIDQGDEIFNISIDQVIAVNNLQDGLGENTETEFTDTTESAFPLREEDEEEEKEDLVCRYI